MKKLNVEAVVIDLRHVSEETLASYEHIQIHAALAMTGPRTEALLAKYPVELDATSVQCYDDDAKVNMVNGKTELTASHKPEGKSVLIVNGKVLCPAGLAGLVTEKCTINGKLAVYPDEAVVLKGTVKLDRSFLLRAQARLYWTEKQFVAVDPKLDVAALAAKGARFAAPKAILLEQFTETLAPLFTENTELIVLPEGTAVVDDDFELTPKTFRRYGSKLYVMGDVNISDDAAEVLGQVEYLHASGDVSLPAALEDVFYAIPDVEYEDLQMLTGHVVRNKPLLNIKPELLELDPAGVTCANCAVVTLDKTLTPEEIVAKLRLNCCAIVRCTAAQEAAAAAVAVNVAQIKVTDVVKEEKDPDTLYRTGVELTL